MKAEENLHRLRSLLLPGDQPDLLGLQQRIEVLERSATGPARAATTVSLSDEEEGRLARVLQPQMGRILRGYAVHMLGRLSARTNGFVHALLSWRRMKLRLKAIITGQSMRELVDSELRQTEVRRLYFIVRDAGILLFHWSNPDFVEEPGSETLDEVMTTAHVMTEFAPDRRDMPLRAINLSQSPTLFQASPRHVAAVEFTGGILRDERRAMISHAFGAMFDAAAMHRSTDAQSLKRETFTAFATSLVSRQKKGRDRRASPARILAVLAILGCLGWYGWRSYHQMQIMRAAGDIEQVIRRNFRPGDVVVDVEPDRAARRITVTGLGFGPGTAAQIERRAQSLAQPYALDFDLVVRDLDGARLERDALAASLSDAQIALAAARDEMSRMGARAVGSGTAPTDALRSWTTANAVFFARNTTPRDEARMNGQLDTLAALMKAASESRLRIEGFTGGDNREPERARRAKARALVIAEALVLRGIAPRRLNPMGGHRPFPAISEGNGLGSPNERVEFSLAFAGE